MKMILPPFSKGGNPFDFSILDCSMKFKNNTLKVYFYAVVKNIMTSIISCDNFFINFLFLDLSVFRLRKVWAFSSMAHSDADDSEARNGPQLAQ